MCYHGSREWSLGVEEFAAACCAGRCILLNILLQDLTGWEPDWLFLTVESTAAICLLALMGRDFPRPGDAWKGLVDTWRSMRGDTNTQSEALYRAKLVARLQSYHLGGNDAPLERIFVAPRLLAPQSGLTDEESLFAGPTTMHYLWPHLADGMATIAPPTATLAELLSHGRRTVISGEPGSGKTTLLAYCAILCARNQTEVNYPIADGTLPVYVHVGELIAPAAEQQEPQDGSGDPLAMLLGVMVQSGLATRDFETMLRAAAREQRLFLLIDGWDDLPGSDLGRAGGWLRDLLKEYPATRVLMAAPVTGYGPLMRLGFVVSGLLRWRSGQAQRVGQEWARAMERDGAPVLPSYWEPGQLSLDTVLRLGQAAHDGRAGKRQVALLQRHVSDLLEATTAGTVDPTRRVATQTLWQRLAVKMLEEGAWRLAAESVHEVVAQIAGARAASDPEGEIQQLLGTVTASGLFVISNDGSVRFLSPLLRDYLAARHELQLDWPATLAAHVNDPKWVQVMKLYVAERGTAGLRRVIEGRPEMSPSVFQIAEWLAGVHGQEQWYKEILIRLGRICLDAERPLMARQRAAAALAATGAPGVATFMNQLGRQYEPVMRQVALAVMARVSPEDTIDVARRLLSDSDATVRVAAVQAIGWMSGPEAEQALLEALAMPDEPVSLAAAVSLALNGREKDYSTLRDAASDENFVMQRSARFGLRIVDEPWVYEFLTKLASEAGGPVMGEHAGLPGDVAEAALAKKWRPSRAGDQPWLVEWSLAKGQVVPVGQAAVPFLLEALKDNEDSIRLRAAATLGQLASLDGLGPLKRALQDEAPDVRQAAYIALAKIARAWDVDS